jgi:hypothetical protein
MDSKERNKLEVFTYRWISDCEDVITSWDDCKDFALHKCILDWSPRRTSSRGGWYATGPGINIAMNNFVKTRSKIYRMYEYPSFDDSSVIGGFYASDPNLAIGMTICHEMAHAVQFYRVLHLGNVRGKPHGEEFKIPYAMIRRAIFNKLLPDQVKMKQEYDALVNNIVKPYRLANTKELNHLFGI